MAPVQDIEHAVRKDDQLARRLAALHHFGKFVMIQDNHVMHEAENRKSSG
jgi:hypothetical protein